MRGRVQSLAVAGRIVLAVASVLTMLAACGDPYRKAETRTTYTVRKGDTLYSIAWRHGLDYRELARWNSLPSDYRIYPGQVLVLRPRPGMRASTTPPKPAATPPPRPVKPPAPAPADDVASWVRPTEGAITAVRHAPTGSHGVTIEGQEGQIIRAAAGGKVVYTGSGLRGFGQLIIIKHTNVFLSAYGHNRTLKVKEGDDVSGGQAIAEMGRGPGQKPMVYFEIRYNGEPVDPRLYLPRHPPG